MAGAARYASPPPRVRVLPSETRRYPDPATEFDVYRLTDPAHQSWLPASYERAVSRRDSFLIYSSDRAGSVQAYRMDLKSGQSRTLTRAENLVRESLTLAPDERNFYYLDGRSRVSGQSRQRAYAGSPPDRGGFRAGARVQRLGGRTLRALGGTEAGNQPAAADHAAFWRGANGSGIARSDFRSSAAPCAGPVCCTAGETSCGW